MEISVKFQRKALIVFGVILLALFVNGGKSKSKPGLLAASQANKSGKSKPSGK